jgi:hypothetical protein
LKCRYNGSSTTQAESKQHILASFEQFTED